MALSIGTNCGFVTTAPTADPGGAASLGTEDRGRGMIDTSPVGNYRVIEIGAYENNADNDLAYECGIYNDAGNSEPEDLVGKGTGQTTGTGAGWKIYTGLSITISSNTSYWICLAMNDGAGSNAFDGETGGGPGSVNNNTILNGILPNDWGTDPFPDADGMVAIYALIEQVESTGLEGQSMPPYVY